VELRCAAWAATDARCMEIIEAPSDVTIARLKERASEIFNIPTLCQKLVISCRAGSLQVVPNDASELLGFCNAERHVVVTVVLSIDQVLQDVGREGSTCDARKRALASVVTMGRRGGERCLEALLTCSDDSSALIRQVVVLALPRVFAPGCPRAQAVLRRMVEDQEDRVRRAAWVTLAAMARTV